MFILGVSSINEVLGLVHLQGCILVDLTADDSPDIYTVLEKNIFWVSVKENAVAYLMALHYVFNNINYDKAAAPALLLFKRSSYSWRKRERR